ncbi:MAG: hypothetical protein WEB50_00980 [Vicinamibacterales bacterium]
MRLPLEEGLRPLQKVALRVVKAMTGRASGPVLVASYNKAFFGNGWAPCMKDGMRGATEWSIGEIELFAAFVSRINSCAY